MKTLWIVFIVMLILKIAELVTWSWWIVFTPVILNVCIALTAFIGVILIASTKAKKFR